MPSSTVSTANLYVAAAVETPMRIPWMPFSAGKLICFTALLAVSPCTTGLPWNPNELPFNFHAIIAGQAYRSAQPDATNLTNAIQRFEIKTVINLRGENPDDEWWQQEQDVCSNLGADLVNISMSAKSLPSRENLLLLYDTFQTAKYPILMHCQGGADRSGAAAAIWRMVVVGDPKDDAQQELSTDFFHFSAFTPHMDFLVTIFEPSRDWILNEYDPQRTDQPTAPPW